MTFLGRSLTVTAAVLLAVSLTPSSAQADSQKETAEQLPVPCSCEHCHQEEQPFFLREAKTEASDSSSGGSSSNSSTAPPPPSCWNLAPLNSARTACDCAAGVSGWTGKSCDTRVCAKHAKNNDVLSPSADHAAPDPKTNLCTKQCDSGWDGLSCSLCETDASCGKDEFCDAAMLVPGPVTEEANMQCDVTSTLFNKLLGSDATGIAAFNCRLPNRTHLGGSNAADNNNANGGGSGSSPSSSSDGSGGDGIAKTGNCSLSFFRERRNPSSSTRVDNYFHCELDQCAATHETVLGHESPAATKATKLVYDFARVFVLLLVAGFIVIGMIRSRPLRMQLVGILGVASLGLLFLVVIAIWAVSAADRAQSITHVIKYDCESSHCACFNNSGLPADLNPDSCLSKDFGRKLIPQLRSGMWLKCEVKTTLVSNGALSLDSASTDCTFLQKDLNSEVGLKCKGRTCQKKKIDWNAWAGGKRVKANETSSSSYHFTDIVKEKGVATGLLVMFALILVGLGCWWLKTVQQRTRDSEKDFQESFLASSGSGSGVGGSSSLHHGMGQSTDELGHSRSPSIATTSNTTTRNSVVGAMSPVGGEEDDDSPSRQQPRPDMSDIFGPDPSAAAKAGTAADQHQQQKPAAASNSTASEQQQQQQVTMRTAAVAAPTSNNLLDTSMSISAVDFSYSVPNTTTEPNRSSHDHHDDDDNNSGGRTPLPVTRVLRNVSIHLKAGSLIALKGSSGAGKTSLLEAFAGLLPGNHTHQSTSIHSHDVFDSKPRNDYDGSHLHREPAVSGAILVDGRDVFPNPLSCGAVTTEYRAFCRCSSIVAQQDILIDSLTVREMIYYSARLKLPSALTGEQLADIVDVVIQLVRLQDVADRIIGGDVVGRGLSGGERRRCSIGVELVGLPRILFCDEPVSALDSVSALAVVECLADIAAGRSRLFGHPALGRYAEFRPLVLMSVHQESESIYRLFDTTVLLHKGRLVCCCAAQSALPFLLEHVRPELMARSAVAGQTVPERLISVSEFPEYELDVAVRATEQSMLAAMAAADLPSRFFERYRDDLQQRCEIEARRAEHGSSGHRRVAGANNWLMDEQNTNGTAATSPVRQQQQQQQRRERQQQDAMNIGNSGSASSSSDRPVVPAYVESEYAPVSRIQVAAQHRERFALNWGAQVGYLAIRGWRAAVSSYHLIFAHALSTLFLGIMLGVAYHAEPLDLSGALNRAGSITYMLLVTAFLSLSVCDWVVGERRLRAHEMRNHCYSTPQYLLAKCLTDLVPLRIVPSIMLSVLVYSPMGLRTDGGSYFMWFCAINALFAAQVVGMVITCAGLVVSFGGAALLSVIVILVNFVFCGLLIQASTLPSIFIPFRDLSPFYNAFAAQMSNVLDGLTCLFNPSGADGRPSSTAITIYCRQFLLNEGVVPAQFTQNLMLLSLFTGIFFLTAGLALNGVPEWCYLWRQKFWSCCPLWLWEWFGGKNKSGAVRGAGPNTVSTVGGISYTAVEAAPLKDELVEESTTATAVAPGARRQAAAIVDDE